MGIKNYKRDKIPKYDDIQAAKTKKRCRLFKVGVVVKAIALDTESVRFKSQRSTKSV